MRRGTASKHKAPFASAKEIGYNPTVRPLKRSVASPLEGPVTSKRSHQ
jgi:hypothetical protein